MISYSEHVPEPPPQKCDRIAKQLVAAGASHQSAHTLARTANSQNGLGSWAARYMIDKVGKGSKNTTAAKTRDLADFVVWVSEHCCGDLMPIEDIGHWRKTDTSAFLHHQQQLGKSIATLNRSLYTLKHFARYVHEQPGGMFMRHGFPVADIAAMQAQTPVSNDLSIAQVQALFDVAQAAAEKAVKKGKAAVKQSRTRPRRDLAILGLFYYTGLRVSEVVELTRAQYDGDALHHVKGKSTRKTRKTLLHPECQRLIDYYIQQERDMDAAWADDLGGFGHTGPGSVIDASRPLFMAARTGGALNRRRVASMLAGLAKKASLHIGELFHVHPHQLRHTFGTLYREASGSDVETAAALGHAGLQYVGRYVRKADEDRSAVLERALSLA